MQKGMFTLALALGGMMAYVDGRPGWDDAGITAFAILAVCGGSR